MLINLPRLLLLVVLLFQFTPSHAAWTGIGAFIVQADTDWLLDSDQREADIDYFGLRIEEKTEVDLRIGASAGQFDVRLVDRDGSAAISKYSGKFISFYLRWPHQLTESVRLHSLLNYQFHLGDQSEGDADEIDWNEITFNFGISLRLGRLSIRP